MLVAALGACGGEPKDDSSDSPTAESVAAAATEAPPIPTETEAPTEVPTVAPTPEPIHLEGSGQTATDPVAVGFPVSVVAFTHGGSRNFIVKGYEAGGKESFLANKIGTYSGEVLLDASGAGTWTFDVNADGPWTIDIMPPGRTDAAAFSGTGDQVSDIFDPPAPGPWEFSHDGKRNFIVKALCGGGTEFVQNQIGPVSGSGMVKFDEGPCLWSVEADGNWSLSPRQ